MMTLAVAAEIFLGRVSLCGKFLCRNYPGIIKDNDDGRIE
jgi:hypothetical protein